MLLQVMIGHFEGIKSLVFAGFSCFIFLFKILNISLTAGFQNVHPRENVPQVVYYQKQVGDFGVIFVRKYSLALIILPF